MTGIPEFPEEFIANYLDAGNLAAMSDRYRPMEPNIDRPMEPNIRSTSHVLACESGRSTITGGCKGLQRKKREKTTNHPVWD